MFPLLAPFLRVYISSEVMITLWRHVGAIVQSFRRLDLILESIRSHAVNNLSSACNIARYLLHLFSLIIGEQSEDARYYLIF